MKNKYWNELEKTLPLMIKKFSMPEKDKRTLSYDFMDALLRKSKNPDYICKELPSHCAQQILKNVCRDMKAFQKASAAYKKNPSSFTGKPKLPGYHTKGGCCTYYFTNQQCIIRDSEVRFPLTKLTLKLGKYIKDSWKLKQITVTPYYDVFMLNAIFDDGTAEKAIPEESKYICSIDLGVNNFAACTNNKGLECLLFKGGAVKNINRMYNKKIAEIQSVQTKGTTNKFVTTPEVKAIAQKRDAVIDDFMHKVAKRIITWCVANEIDTVVVGENKGWKQNSNIGKTQNQNFVQIPFSKFKFILSYLCERNGIRYITQEESYTSRASFLDNDVIPVYKSDNDKYTFSGKRGPTKYKGQRKKSGFRGIYRSKDGTCINADLNGSANIGRKAFPKLFTAGSVCFDKVKLFRHPDLAV